MSASLDGTVAAGWDHRLCRRSQSETTRVRDGNMPSLPEIGTYMLDKILFWVVLVWMIGMLVMTFLAVREVIREDAAGPPTPDDTPKGDDKPRDQTSSSAQ